MVVLRRNPGFRTFPVKSSLVLDAGAFELGMCSKSRGSPGSRPPQLPPGVNGTAHECEGGAEATSSQIPGGAPGPIGAQSSRNKAGAVGRPQGVLQF